MDWDKEFYDKDEKPLDKLADGISNTAIFRRIAFIGDSLASGEFETVDKNGVKNYYDMYEYSWGQYIARKYGLKALNFSKGGMTAKEYVDDFADDNGFWDENKACQAYVIALGVNDLDQGIPIGCKGDIDVNDYRNNKKTFMGYYGTIVSKYKAIQPDAKFFFVTFPKTVGDEKHIKKSENHVNAMYSMSEIFENSYVVDLYKYGPIYDDDFKKNFYLNDHLNASGYILTARMIDSYIDYIVRHNPNDFQNVPFIGTDFLFC